MILRLYQGDFILIFSPFLEPIESVCECESDNEGDM